LIKKLVLLLFTTGSFIPFFSLCAKTSYFVDPLWVGAELGTQQFPWKRLTDNTWSQINLALQTGNVTVFFAAHPKATEIDNCYDTDHDGKQDGIDLVRRTEDNSFLLTLDGGSFFRAGNVGEWSSNSSKAMCKINDINSQNEKHRKISRIAINKFRIEKNDNGKAISICGDFWEISNCDIYHTPQVHDGPLIDVVPVADKAHEGSSYHSVPCTDIRIHDNLIHHSCGELIYVGGGGCSKSDPTGQELCQGFPSHKNIFIYNNSFFAGGVYGQEGDAIDCKGGLSNVHIVNNTIFNMKSPSYRAIVMQGQTAATEGQQAIIERNFIHHCTGLMDAAVAIVNNWGTPGKVIVRNNVIAFNDKSAIKVYGGRSIDIMNNTIYKNDGYGIDIEGGTVTVMNNLLIDNTDKYQVFRRNAVVKCFNNGFSGECQDACNHCIEMLSSGVFRNASGNDFIPMSNSKVLEKGIPISGFSEDISGKVRKAGSWTLGAFEMIGDR
jgi:hypothetical protein